MKLVVPREGAAGETRVALVPAALDALALAGFEVVVEEGAGERAGFDDAAYVEHGAKVADEAGAWLGADAVAAVRAPAAEAVAGLRRGAVLVALFSPGAELSLVKAMAGAGVTGFSLELLPRITRAQSMDALSSQATVTGYRGVLLAASRLPRFFPMLMTAAGTIPPAKVFVLGAGVAGLQAVATARRLGAVVTAHDVRPAAKSEVESLGARFVELPAVEVVEGSGGYAAEQPADVLARQREAIAGRVADSDVVLATAAIPGRRAPLVLTREMIEAMRPGSVVVDLAADTGGNAEPTLVGQEVRVGGATVIGVANPAGSMPMHASQLYARNVSSFLLPLVRDGALAPDLEDDVLSASCVTAGGEVRHAPTRSLLEAASTT